MNSPPQEKTQGEAIVTISNNVIPFPPRGPFAVRIERAGPAWLVICRDHGWLHAGYREAIEEAKAIARGFGVVVKVAP